MLSAQQAKHLCISFYWQNTKLVTQNLIFIFQQPFNTAIHTPPRRQGAVGAAPPFKGRPGARLLLGAAGGGSACPLRWRRRAHVVRAEGSGGSGTDMAAVEGVEGGERKEEDEEEVEVGQRAPLGFTFPRGGVRRRGVVLWLPAGLL